MKIGQKFTLLSLIALLQVAQLSATTLNFEVDTGETGDLTKDITVNTLVKKGGGTLNINGPAYDIYYIQVDDGEAVVDDAPSLYLSDPSGVLGTVGAFLSQPATLTAGTYLAKLMAFIVNVPTGQAYVENTITSPLLEKTGDGIADFITNLIIHYLKISAGSAIISQDGVPLFSVQLAGILTGSTDLSIPNVTMLDNGIISNTNSHSVTIEELVLADFMLSTANASTTVEMLDATPSGGTISNADHVILNGVSGDRPIIKQGVGTMTAAEDLSGATTSFDVLAGVLQVSGNGKLPTANMIINAAGGGSTFKLSANLSSEATAGAVPGYMEIQSGCILEVDAGLVVPANSSATDIFIGGLKMKENTTLKLGDGVRWSRPITVGNTISHVSS